MKLRKDQVHQTKKKMRKCILHENGIELACIYENAFIDVRYCMGMDLSTNCAPNFIQNTKTPIF